MRDEQFKDRISGFIAQQFPSLYRETGSDLIAFMEAYFEFLEERYNGINMVRSMFDQGDVDRTLKDFIVHFKDKYLKDFPVIGATDERFLIKHIRDLYGSRGSEKSLKLLFRLLFNEDVEIYTPMADVFRSSASTWVEPFYLELSQSDRTVGFIGKTVTGTTSGATAIIESVVRKRVNKKIIDVAYISAMSGNFETGEIITDGTGDLGAPYVVGSLTSMDITIGGTNYRVGSVLDVYSSRGKLGKVRVKSVENATGRVEFTLEDGGFGYTVSRINGNEYEYASDVLVSTAMLLIDNPTLKFEQFERIIQPKEEIRLISALDMTTAGWDPGDRLIGYDADGNEIANGVIYSMTSLDGDGNTTNVPQSNAIVKVFTTGASFQDQMTLTVANATGYAVSNRVEAGGQVQLTLSAVTGGAIAANTWIKQQKTKTFGSNVIVIGMSEGRVSNVSGSTVVLSPSFGEFTEGVSVITSNGTAMVDLVDVISEDTKAVITSANVTAGTLVVKDIEGNFIANTGIRALPSRAITTISNVVNSGVTNVVLGTSNAVVSDVQTISTRGIVVGQNTIAIGIHGNTTPFEFISVPPVQMLQNPNDMSSAGWTLTNLNVLPVSGEALQHIGAISAGNAYAVQQVSVTSGTDYRMAMSVSTTNNAPSVILGFPSQFGGSGPMLVVDMLNGIGTMVGSGYTLVRMNVRENAIAGWDIELVLTATASATNAQFWVGLQRNGQGTAYSDRTVSIRNLFVNEDIVTAYGDIVTDREHAEDNVQAVITGIGTGAGAGFEVGDIENQETISTNTDIIGSLNITEEVRYPSIQINGEGSGIGLVGSVVITDGGSGYANGAAVSFTGGGPAGGEPFVVATGTIVTDSSGSITDITITNPGNGYFSTPTVVLPATSGDTADVVPVPVFGYGFPINPFGGFNTIIADCLTIDTMTIGTISRLSFINPGSGYNMQPFIAVRNPLIATFQRRDIIMNIVTLTGEFVVGETITQQIEDPGSPGTFVFAKGVVKQSGAGVLFVKRLSFGIAFDMSAPIIGTQSGATATVLNIDDDEASLAMGENAMIGGNVITANGTIASVDVIDSGYGYEDGESGTLVSATNASVAEGVIRLGQQGKSQGFWQTTDSHPSHDKYLQDSHYYQAFSYQIESAMSFDKYQHVVDSVLHMAGSKMFGAVVINSFMDNTYGIVDVQTGLYASDFKPNDIWSESDRGWILTLAPGTVFLDHNGVTPANPGQTVGMALDTSMNLERGPELKGQFTALYGPTVPSGKWGYDPVTGDGRMYRGTSSSVAGIHIDGIKVGAVYEIVFNNKGPMTISVRHGGLIATVVSGTVAFSGNVTSRQLVVATQTNITLSPFSNSTDQEFTLVSFREIKGNHFVQSTSGARPVYALEPLGGRRNWYANSHDMSTWSNNNNVLTPRNDVISPTDKPVYHIALKSGTFGVTSASPRVVPASNGWILNEHVTVSVYARRSESNYLALGVSSNDGSRNVMATFDLDAGTVLSQQNVGGAAFSIVGRIEPVVNGWYRCSITFENRVTNTARIITTFIASGPGGGLIGDGVSGVFISSPQVERFTSEPTPYQHVYSDNHITEDGVPTTPFLIFNTTNKWLKSMLPTNWDSSQVTIMGRFKKDSDTTRATIISFSNSYTTLEGSFGLEAPDSDTADTFGWTVTGDESTNSVTVSGFTSPAEEIILATADLTQSEMGLTVDEVTESDEHPDSGVNFGNYEAWIGRMGGTSQQFYGRVYPHIVINRILSENQIIGVRNWLTKDISELQ